MNQKDEINFDELFEDNKKETDFIKKSTDFSKQRSLISIVVYLLISILGGLIVSVIFISVQPESVVRRNAYEEMAYQIDKNKYAIGYMAQDEFDSLDASFKSEVKIIYELNGFVFLANPENNYLKNDSPYLLDEILTIYIDTDTTWKNDTNETKIIRYRYSDNDEFQILFDPVFESRDGYQTVQATAGFAPEAAATLQFIVYVILMISIVPLFFNQLKSEWRSSKLSLAGWLPIILIGYFYMIAGNIVGNALSGILSTLFNYEMTTSLNQAAIEEMMLSSSGLLMIIPVVFFAPVVEELVFRKAIFSLFKNEYMALLISSLLFGLIHVSSEASLAAFVVNGVTYIVSGVALGYVYIKNKHNIWASIFVHAFSNAVSVIMIFLLAV